MMGERMLSDVEERGCRRRNARKGKRVAKAIFVKVKENEKEGLLHKTKG